MAPRVKQAPGSVPGHNGMQPYKHYSWSASSGDPAVTALVKDLEAGDEPIHVATLAAQSGVSAGAIYNMLNGKTMSPHLKTVCALAGAKGKTKYDFRRKRFE
jgi:transcriptional regulator with XRE-family HTH domain